MKTLQKNVQIVYRFRCIRCKSVFEMTKEEKEENDWTYHEGRRSREEGARCPHNPMGYFYCPVCNERSYSAKRDEHMVYVMDDGTEYLGY